MPSRQDYDTAILFARARLQVSDPELLGGDVETVRAGTTQKPWGNQGGYAVVYKFRAKSGQLRALRCFTRPIEADIKQRYEALGSYFRQHAREITADFTYYERGILVKEMVQGQPQEHVYQIIDMEWVDGDPLFDYLEKVCKNGDRAALGNLVLQWVGIIHRLRQAKMAHGDLSGMNVMVRKDGRLVLVDYDGVYIQHFGQMKQLLVGTPGFQHPQMQQRPFNELMDDFSLLLIYTALVALQAQPTLWETFTERDPTTGRPKDQTLLFTADDLERIATSGRSKLFEELARSPDARVRAAVQALRRACVLPVDQVRFPLEIIDPEIEQKDALAVLERATRQGDDEQVVQAWVPVLEHYGPAQRFRAQVEQARARIQVRKLVEGFQRALQSGEVQQVARAYADARLESAAGVRPEEREVAKLAQAFVLAWQADDDARIEAAATAISNHPAAGQRLRFTRSESDRIALARQRREAAVRFRQALASQRADQIAAAYDRRLLDGWNGLTPEEREAARLALGWADAWGKDDEDARLARAWEEIQRSPQRAAFVFTSVEQRRIAEAQQRLLALERLRQALRARWVTPIVAAAEQPLLAQYAGVTPEESAVIGRARAFQRAIQAKDDEAIAQVAQEIAATPALSRALSFTTEEQQRVLLAQQRVQALVPFRAALLGSDAQQIVLSYNASLLDGCQSVRAEERARLERARRFRAMYEQVLAALRLNDGKQVGKFYDEELAAEFSDFSPEERQRIAATKNWGLLDVALTQSNYERAIRLAKALEKEQHGRPIEDFRLRLAKRMFIRTCYPRNVMLRRLGSQVQVQWRWPTSDLADAVFVAWRFDRFPANPQDVPPTLPPVNPHFLLRGEGGPEQMGAFTIPAGGAPQVYVLVCAAIMDADPMSRMPAWYFSDGAGVAVQQMVGV